MKSARAIHEKNFFTLNKIMVFYSSKMEHEKLMFI